MEEEENRMDEEQVYATIPAEPELAFLHLEKYFNGLHPVRLAPA